MALLDFLKKKKDTQKAKKAEVKKPGQKPSEKKTAKTAEVASVAKPSVNLKSKILYEAIKRPHISEKATFLSEGGQYVFEIVGGYNKEEIKNAIEGIYGVDVLSVNMVKIPAKKRRLGRTEGYRKAYKKAIVKIKQGQKIEII